MVQSPYNYSRMAKSIQTLMADGWLLSGSWGSLSLKKAFSLSTSSAFLYSKE